MPETALAIQPASMERLDFTLPDFTRLMWVDDRAREVWEPRLVRITAAWLEVEWRSVVAGIRRCGLTSRAPEDLLADEAGPAAHGLHAVPIGTEDGPFPFSAGLQSVLGAAADVAAFAAAWDAGDQQAIAELLGYPPCCHEFFWQVWVDHGLLDTTWPMAVASAAPDPDAATVEIAGPPAANILWRWMGVRAVPHLPCRSDCAASAALGERLLEVGRRAGFAEEMAWTTEILSWPVEWSALHGIAEIKTPVLKVSTRTDATARRYTVRRPGSAYPTEGAAGLVFPYQEPVRPRLTTSPGFQRGLSLRPAWHARDNGFTSVAEMDRAHAGIVEVVVAALGGAGGPVLDLGCGNAALLARIVEAVPDVVPFGIDRDAEHIAHAHQLLPSFTANLVCGDLFTDDRLWAGGARYRVALLMPGRLLEADAAAVANMAGILRSSVDHLVVYAYGDWVQRHGNLAGLANAAGLTVVPSAPDVAALAEFVPSAGTRGSQ